MAQPSIVKDQYERYPYPPPSTDLAADERRGTFVEGEPRLYGPAIWPDGRPQGRLRILSAGCGTDQAAWLAYRDRGADVVGVDISEASLRIERRLKEKHGLSNLELHLMDLNRVGELGQFDLICCTGVLHHLADPLGGLRSLAGALKPGGRMVLMLYGATLRSGVYLLQEAFRTLGLGQDKADVAAARGVFNVVPEFHMAKQYARLTPELSDDAAFVDTFLHPQDRAYTVAELLELVRSAGLTFQEWTDNGFYYPNTHFGAQPEIMNRMRALDQPRLWGLVEQLMSACGTHKFIVTNEAGHRPVSRQILENDWAALVPSRHFDLKVLTKPSPSVRAVELSRGRTRFTLTPEAMAVVELIDGRRSAAMMCADPRFAATDKATVRAFVHNILQELYFRGHVFLSRKPA